MPLSDQKVINRFYLPTAPASCRLKTGNKYLSKRVEINIIYGD
jgi:hypothetical protein